MLFHLVILYLNILSAFSSCHLYEQIKVNKDSIGTIPKFQTGFEMHGLLYLIQNEAKTVTVIERPLKEHNGVIKFVDAFDFKKFFMCSKPGCKFLSRITKLRLTT